MQLKLFTWAWLSIAGADLILFSTTLFAAMLWRGIGTRSSSTLSSTTTRHTALCPGLPITPPTINCERIQFPFSHGQYCILFTHQNVCKTILLNSPRYYSRPKRNGRQRLCKIWGSRQGALWEMWKCWMVIVNRVISYRQKHLHSEREIARTS